MKNHSVDIARRRVVASIVTAGALAPLARLSFAATAGPGDNRLVFVILRGGMDGLYAVPAIGDPDFAPARGVLAQYAHPPLALSGPFALHPDLKQLHALYGRGELAVVHAVGLPYYRGRSHFDAQNMLETGSELPFTLATGWLGRALGSLHAIALTTSTPLALRGGNNVDTWAPSALPPPNADLLARLEEMYAKDAALATALTRARGLRNDAMKAGMAGGSMMGGATDSGASLTTLARRGAEFLSQPDGPRVALLEHEGWDSHGKENDPEGPIVHQMSRLDDALGALYTGLQKGGAWRQTLVVVATEFGREVAVNGTGGTDHGSGGAVFVLGGAVKGGRVIGDWPGLAQRNRYEGRDLRITTDVRAVLKAALSDHLQIATRRIDQDIFPGSAAVKPLNLFG